MTVTLSLPTFLRVVAALKRAAEKMCDQAAAPGPGYNCRDRSSTLCRTCAARASLEELGVPP